MHDPEIGDAGGHWVQRYKAERAALIVAEAREEEARAQVREASRECDVIRDRLSALYAELDALTDPRGNRG